MRETNQKEFNSKDVLNYFIDAIADAVTMKLQLQNQQPQHEITAKSATERKRLTGIRGISTYLGISTGTCQKLKNNGQIPTFNIGRRIYGFSNEIDINR